MSSLRKTAVAAALLFGLATFASPSASATTRVTDHLTEAEEVVDQLGAIAWPEQGDHNKYAASGIEDSIVWGTPGVPTSYYHEAQCAPILTLVLKHTYSWATNAFFRSEFSSTSPNSKQYYSAFAADTADHFDKVNKVADLLPGDAIAIQYPTTTPSGHTAIVRAVEGTIETDSDPDTTEYVVHVLDATSNPHGVAPVPGGHGDTRSRGAHEYAGIGYGFMVFYADANGDFLGYRWGTNESTVHSVTGSGARPIAAARATSEP